MLQRSDREESRDRRTIMQVKLVGWFVFVLSWGAVATCVVEMIQLLFGRRDWLGHLASNVGASTLGEAIGGGVWLAGLASIALAVNASTYLWLRHQLWRENPR